MTLGFAKQPLTRYVARGMRAATKGRELDGHRFTFTDLKELYISDDEHHVVATHAKDPVWQYWLDTPNGGGWVLASAHHSLRAACSAACDHEYGEPLPEPGALRGGLRGRGPQGDPGAGGVQGGPGAAHQDLHPAWATRWGWKRWVSPVPVERTG